MADSRTERLCILLPASIRPSCITHSTLFSCHYYQPASQRNKRRPWIVATLTKKSRHGIWLKKYGICWKDVWLRPICKVCLCLYGEPATLNEHNCKVLGTIIHTHTVKVVGENHDCQVSIHQPVGRLERGQGSRLGNWLFPRPSTKEGMKYCLLYSFINYCIVGDFSGRKCLQISRFYGYSRKFSPQNLEAWHLLAAPASISRKFFGKNLSFLLRSYSTYRQFWLCKYPFT